MTRSQLELAIKNSLSCLSLQPLVPFCLSIFFRSTIELVRMSVCAPFRKWFAYYTATEIQQVAEEEVRKKRKIPFGKSTLF